MIVTDLIFALTVSAATMATEQFCLRWNDFHANITAAFSEIKEDEDFLDVTLVSNNDENAKI